MSADDHPLAPFFKKIPLFAGLSGDELNEILSGIRSQSLGDGKVLFSEGEPGDAAYVVESGVVEVWAQMDGGDEISVATLQSGEVIGELALIDGARRNATIRAVKDTQLLRIDKVEFDFLRRNSRPAAFKLIRAITQVVCARLRETNEQISAILEPAEDRSVLPVQDGRAAPGVIGRIFSWKKS
jgi:CRP/FNR family cyclic AMP-dependent transcriptional regulator